jgi:nicotinamidase-related amidase
LRRACGALAKLCALHDVPAFLSSVPQAGTFAKRVVEPLGDPALRPRSVTSAFGDPQLVDDVKASGRTILLLSGVASEIVVLRTALDAVDAGYEVHILIDACGGFSDRTEAAAWSRATAAGAIMSSVVTAAAEMAGDFSTEVGEKTLMLVYEAAGK